MPSLHFLTVGLSGHEQITLWRLVLSFKWALIGCQTGPRVGIRSYIGGVAVTLDLSCG